jgi:hypothetical protein
MLFWRDIFYQAELKVQERKGETSHQNGIFTKSFASSTFEES